MRGVRSHQARTRFVAQLRGVGALGSVPADAWPRVSHILVLRWVLQLGKRTLRLCGSWRRSCQLAQHGRMGSSQGGHQSFQWTISNFHWPACAWMR